MIKNINKKGLIMTKKEYLSIIQSLKDEYYKNRTQLLKKREELLKSGISLEDENYEKFRKKCVKISVFISALDFFLKDSRDYCSIISEGLKVKKILQDRGYDELPDFVQSKVNFIHNNGVSVGVTKVVFQP